MKNIRGQVRRDMNEFTYSLEKLKMHRMDGPIRARVFFEVDDALYDSIWPAAAAAYIKL